MAIGTKTGGRTKGTVNKTTTEIREYYKKLVSNSMVLLDKDSKSLEPLQRLKIKLSKFVTPTLKQQDVVLESGQGTNIISLSKW
ncbi:MAG: L-amino acid N-acyltransferase YncA, partial [Flavobacterium sp.]